MNYITKISLNLIATFMVIIFSSFIPEYFPDFFGDTVCNGAWIVGKLYTADSYLAGCQGYGIHPPTTHWGYRHYLWFFMGLTLFCIQIVRIAKIKYDVK